MSQFGYGTFKQDLLEYIERESKQHGIDTFDAIGEVSEVLSYLALNAWYRDEALSNLYEKAKSDARQELINKIK